MKFNFNLDVVVKVLLAFVEAAFFFFFIFLIVTFMAVFGYVAKLAI